MDSLYTRVDAIEEILQKLETQGLPVEAVDSLKVARDELELLRGSIQATRIQNTKERAHFVSVVTHELRIPLTSIKGYTDLMRQGAIGPVNEQQISFLEVIRNNVERMSALITNLSDIAKLETGRLRVTCNPFLLHLQAEQILKSLAPKLEEKNQSLVNNLTADLPMVFADATRVTQALTSLVDNASHYTPVGGEVQINARRDGGFVRIEVSDNGIGINPTDQEKVFDQFFRSEDQVVREAQGWGLNLAVSKLFVEAMGGAIGFISSSGEGSTFWFTLPISEQGCIDQE